MPLATVTCQTGVAAGTDEQQQHQRAIRITITMENKNKWLQSRC